MWCRLVTDQHWSIWRFTTIKIIHPRTWSDQLRNHLHEITNISQEHANLNHTCQAEGVWGVGFRVLRTDRTDTVFCVHPVLVLCSVLHSSLRLGCTFTRSRHTTDTHARTSRTCNTCATSYFSPRASPVEFRVCRVCTRKKMCSRSTLVWSLSLTLRPLATLTSVAKWVSC